IFMHGGESSFSRLLGFMVVSRLRRLSCHRPVGIIILAPLRGSFLSGTSCNGSSAALRSRFPRPISILMECNLGRLLHIFFFVFCVRCWDFFFASFFVFVCVSPLGCLCGHPLGGIIILAPLGVFFFGRD